MNPIRSEGGLKKARTHPGGGLPRGVQGGAVGLNNAPSPNPTPYDPLPRLTVLDLFSGIGGFSLAFHAAGFRTVAFSEVEAYPSRVLAQRFPGIPNQGDVRQLDGAAYAGVDVVCGGFPCQDISSAGKGEGIHGSRSKLWFEALRVVRGARPRFCLFENVPALRSRGADEVFNGLEAEGYSCRAFVVGAVHAGAPHRRQRVWIVAYANGSGQSAGQGEGQAWDDVGRSGPPACDPDFKGLEVVVDGKPPKLQAAFGTDWWGTEPDVGRVAHGVPARVDRIKALGNAIVPQVAYPFALWMAGGLSVASKWPAAAQPGYHEATNFSGHKPSTLLNEAPDGSQ